MEFGDIDELLACRVTAQPPSHRVTAPPASSDEVRPCSKGHRDRYASGACRACRLERYRSLRLGMPDRRAEANRRMAAQRGKALRGLTPSKRLPVRRIGTAIGLSQNERERIDAAARRQGVTRSLFMRQAVVAALAAEEAKR